MSDFNAIKTERISYWKCSHCLGTGRVIYGGDAGPHDCSECDGTGNALIDGATERHKRALAEIDSHA